MVRDMSEYIPGELAYHGQGYEDYYYGREREEDETDMAEETGD